MYRELGDWRGEADILFNLGTVARERRRHGSAYEYYTAAMRLATEHADRLREARVSVSRGILSRRLHDHEMARHWWREAIRRYEELGRDDMVRSVRKRLSKLPPTSPRTGIAAAGITTADPAQSPPIPPIPAAVAAALTERLTRPVPAPARGVRVGSPWSRPCRR